MIPVTQNKVVVRNAADEIVVNGNCYAAAIASILEVPITEVPNVEVFYKWDTLFWDDIMNKWLSLMGYELVNGLEFIVFHEDIIDKNDYSHINIEEEKERLKDKFYLVSGKSIRGVFHICIYQNGKLVHDPHPTKDGLITLENFQEIIKL